MTQAINPNTNIPMSLQVEKIQQMRSVHDMQQQGQITQETEEEKRLHNQRVNSNDGTEKALIREKQEKNKQSKKEKQSDDKKNNSSDQKKDDSQLGVKKGRILDVKA